MKRVIKFRAWEKPDDSIGFPGKMHYDIIQYLNDWLYSDDYEIMQFTGLKDKNEKEIYEGDVIELVNDAGEKIRVVCEYGTARRHVMSGGIGIEVDIPCFYFLLSNGKRSFPIVKNYAGKHDLQIFEVIGNIYENPELLSPTK